MWACSTKRMALLLALGAGVLCCAACGNDHNSSTAATTAPAAAAPATVIPDEEAAAAKAALGSDAQVLLFGEVGGAGTQQVVAIDALPGAPSAPMDQYIRRGAPTPPNIGEPGVKVSRVSILDKENGSWSEVLRVDEYLKNRNGYLRGGPATAVAGWSLQPGVEGGRQVLHFTALAPEAAVRSGPISVAWNPKTKLYQSLDLSGKQFLGETRTLDTAKSQMK